MNIIEVVEPVYILLGRLFLAHIVINNVYNLNIFCRILLFEIRILAVPFIPKNNAILLLFDMSVYTIKVGSIN